MKTRSFRRGGGINSHFEKADDSLFLHKSLSLSPLCSSFLSPFPPFYRLFHPFPSSSPSFYDSKIRIQTHYELNQVKQVEKEKWCASLFLFFISLDLRSTLSNISLISIHSLTWLTLKNFALFWIVSTWGTRRDHHKIYLFILLFIRNNATWEYSTSTIHPRKESEKSLPTLHIPQQISIHISLSIQVFKVNPILSQTIQ